MFGTIAEFQAWCEAAPAGTNVDAHALAEVIAAVIPSGGAPEEGKGEEGSDPGPEPWTWRERLWTVPAETRLGVAEVAEALGRPKSFVYARTQKNAAEPIPHRKLDGTLVFAAGELRAWIRAQEKPLVAGPMESTPEERRVGLRAM